VGFRPAVSERTYAGLGSPQALESKLVFATSSLWATKVCGLPLSRWPVAQSVPAEDAREKDACCVNMKLK
jgi:hypothetical protein